MLTLDQRWLLFHMGGWNITWALTDPAGVQYLMTSRWGSTGGHTPAGGPKWLGGFDTTAKSIRATQRGGPRVEITPAQINRYAKNLPAEVRAELIACRTASQAELRRTDHWCHCPKGQQLPDRGDCKSRPPYFAPSYHPTDAEVDAHYAELRRIRDWETAALRRALDLDSGQLELFGVAS